jgi:hypothetical protein
VNEPPATLLRSTTSLVARHPLVAALGLVALTLLAHAVILATPGFYSHDEWQKFDHIRLHGFSAFARAYGIPQPGPEFGYPVRPIGFVQQGFAALWMQSAPLASHLVSVLNPWLDANERCRRNDHRAVGQRMGSDRRQDQGIDPWMDDGSAALHHVVVTSLDLA